MRHGTQRQLDPRTNSTSRLSPLAFADLPPWSSQSRLPLCLAQVAPTDRALVNDRDCLGDFPERYAHGTWAGSSSRQRVLRLGNQLDLREHPCARHSRNQAAEGVPEARFPPRSLPIDLVLDRCDVDYASGNDDLAGSPALHRRIFRPLLKRQVKSGRRAAFERFQDGRAVVGVPSDLFFVSNLRDRHSELLTSVSSGFRRSIPIREDSRKIGKVGEERVAVYRRLIGSVTENSWAAGLRPPSGSHRANYAAAIHAPPEPAPAAIDRPGPRIAGRGRPANRTVAAEARRP